MMTLLEGKNYFISHSRKGDFYGTIISQNEEWAEVMITDGKAMSIRGNSLAEGGEKINVRKDFCQFELIK